MRPAYHTRKEQKTLASTAGDHARGRNVPRMRIPRNALLGRIWSYSQRIMDKLMGVEALPSPPSPQQRAAPGSDGKPSSVTRSAPGHADERTFRRIAEAERGGLSSKESAARYMRGENPGGLHHKAVHHEGPEHQRPAFYEPQERKETVPGGERHIAVMRRGC